MLAAKILSVRTDDRRGSEREMVIAPSTVRHSEGAPIDVVVEDISATGLAFRGTVDVGVGEIVRVGLSGAGVVEAVVVRREDTLYACQFVRPISDAMIADAFSNTLRVHPLYSGVVGGDERIALPSRWPGFVRVGLFGATTALIWYGITRAIF